MNDLHIHMDGQSLHGTGPQHLPKDRRMLLVLRALSLWMVEVAGTWLSTSSDGINLNDSHQAGKHKVG